MANKRWLAGILGVIAIMVAVYVTAPLVLESFWDPCRLSLIGERPSPSGRLVARHYRAVQCDKQPLPESQVRIAEARPGHLGARVFATPYEFIDKMSGNKRQTEIQLVWRGEDFLQIFYSKEIFPRDPGHSVTFNGLEVRVDSKYIESPSNSQMQPGPAPAPAADLKR
jgi:hypothetical protein